MRKLILASLPGLAVLAVSPAAAQVSGHVRIDIPIGRPAVFHAVPHREVIVRPYDAYSFGDWESYYDDWSPVTLYLYGGSYYDYPIVAWARPVVVYRYRDQFFFPPRDRRFDTWRRGRIVAPVARPRPQFVAPRRDDRGFGRVERAPVRVAPDRRGGGGGRDRAPAPARGGSRGGGGASHGRGGHGH